MAKIKLVNINKTFWQKDYPLQVLKRINLLIDEPGLYVLCGPSGSGKTTLLNLISGLDFPTSGKVYINDKLIDYKPTNIALIFQNHYLFNDLTAFDNVCLSAYITNQEINLESINLLFKQFQLTHIINQKVKFCSGGEKQRISILRAIVSNPEIIIADEPTGALDEKTANIIVDNFKKLSYKRIIIVITHNKKLFKKVADKIFNLKNGQLYEENTKTMEESYCI